MTMRYAHLAPQYNRAAVDRLVPAAKSGRTTKGGRAVRSENKVVTKSVTIRNRLSVLSTESQNNLNNNNDLQDVAP